MRIPPPPYKQLEEIGLISLELYIIHTAVELQILKPTMIFLDITFGKS